MAFHNKNLYEAVWLIEKRMLTLQANLNCKKDG